MLDTHPGQQALMHLERVLEQRPKKDDHALSFATQGLAAFREELIARQRDALPASDDRNRLVHLNGIISIVMAMHFPLGNAPWDEFEKAVGWLRALVSAVEDAPG
jgi:hypothetical protein